MVSGTALRTSHNKKKQRISPLLLSGLVPSPRYFANFKIKAYCSGLIVPSHAPEPIVEELERMTASAKEQK